VVVEVGETVGVLFKEGEPTPLSMEIEVAPAMFHWRVADRPVVIVLGFAVKLLITGGTETAAVTEMIVDAVIVPELLVALIVYVVVAVGDTDCVPEAETVLMPWSIDTEVAPVIFHLSVEDWPVAIVTGLAENSVTTGKPDPVPTTLTVASAVTEPALLVAVSL
jgi:hypothetical protein